MDNLPCAACGVPELCDQRQIAHHRLPHELHIRSGVAQSPGVPKSLDPTLGDENRTAKTRGELLEGAKGQAEVPEVAVVDSDEDVHSSRTRSTSSSSWTFTIGVGLRTGTSGRAPVF